MVRVLGLAALASPPLARSQDRLFPIPGPVLPDDLAKKYPGNDVFYRRKDLNVLKANGVDISGFNEIPESSEPLSRGLVAHSKWFERELVDGEMKTILPWAFHADFPMKSQTREIINRMNADLGCVANVEVPVEELQTTHHTFGVLLVWSTLTGGGCWTTTGIAPGFTGLSGKTMADLGAPNTWQVISLDINCDGLSETTIQHEFLHAWGFQERAKKDFWDHKHTNFKLSPYLLALKKHEQSRPDRSSFINVNFGNTDSDEQFRMLEHDEWIETEFPYEIRSVLHYCSTCGTNGAGPVMTKHDGSFFSGGRFMSTTDALQLQSQYCTPEETMHALDCRERDEFGFERKIFASRVCDGRADCPNAEDETGSIASCIPTGELTPNGCCSELMVEDDLCHFSQSWFEFDLWVCESNPDKVVLRFNDEWYIGLTGIPTDTFNYIAKKSAATTCPEPGRWSDGPAVLYVFCASAGPNWDANLCSEISCGDGAECVINNSQATCQCIEGWAAEEDGSCTEIPILDECALGIHNCHINATCTDIQLGFKCECCHGYDDQDPTRPGTNCVKTKECCRKFTIGVPHHDFYNAICVYTRTQQSGFIDYTCEANEQFPNHWWNFPMSVQYAPLFNREYFFQTGGLTDETNINWSEIWDRQSRTDKDGQKCPSLEPPSAGNNLRWTTMQTNCLEFFQTVDSPCSLGTHSCDVNSVCMPVDSFGNYNCNCKVGFSRPAVSNSCLALVDECSSGLHECDENAFCHDKTDGYGCICEENFVGNGFHCERITPDAGPAVGSTTPMTTTTQSTTLMMTTSTTTAKPTTTSTTTPTSTTTTTTAINFTTVTSTTTSTSTTKTSTTTTTTTKTTRMPKIELDTQFGECLWPKNALTSDWTAKFEPVSGNKIVRKCPSFCIWETKECHDYSDAGEHTCVQQNGFHFFTRSSEDSKWRDEFFFGENHDRKRKIGLKMLCDPRIFIKDTIAACGELPRIPDFYQKFSEYGNNDKTIGKDQQLQSIDSKKAK